MPFSLIYKLTPYHWQRQNVINRGWRHTFIWGQTENEKEECEYKGINNKESRQFMEFFGSVNLWAQIEDEKETDLEENDEGF